MCKDKKWRKTSRFNQQFLQALQAITQQLQAQMPSLLLPPCSLLDLLLL
jgi:hypothetical protein